MEDQEDEEEQGVEREGEEDQGEKAQQVPIPARVQLTFERKTDWPELTPYSCEPYTSDICRLLARCRVQGGLMKLDIRRLAELINYRAPDSDVPYFIWVKEQVARINTDSIRRLFPTDGEEDVVPLRQTCPF